MCLKSLFIFSATNQSTLTPQQAYFPLICVHGKLLSALAMNIKHQVLEMSKLNLPLHRFLYI